MTIRAEDSAPSHLVDRVPVDWLVDGEITPQVQRLRRLIARAQVRAAEVVAAAHRRGVPQAQGFASTTAWLITVSGEPPQVCRSRVRVALASQHMQHTREAFAAVDLCEPRVRLLVDSHESSPDVFARDERMLVAQARSPSSRVFPVALRHWRRLADPDGALADADRAFERRRLCVSATWEGLAWTGTWTRSPARWSSLPTRPWPNPPAGILRTPAARPSAAPTLW